MKNQKLIIAFVIISGVLVSSILIFYFLNLTKQEKYSNFNYLACNFDDDCTTTKIPINSCCIDCKVFPVNKQGLKLQKEWRKDNCGSKEKSLCVTLKCLWSDKNVACVQNQCVFIEKVSNFKPEEFSLTCEQCSSQDKSLILSTAEKTLEVIQKEFLWMAGAVLRVNYKIEVNPSDASAGGRSYVDYKNRTIELTRIYIPTIAHEISHLLVAEYFGIGKNSLLSDIYPKGPSWFQEGLAMYLEYGVDNSRRDDNISLLKNTSTFFSLSEFESGSGSNIKLWYAQSWSILDYLIQKYGKERFKILCECVKQKLPPVIGDPPWSECFDNVYKDASLNWDSFYEEWVEYAKKI